MKEIPILFSTPMVQAILEGRKTVTRRLIDIPDLQTAPDRFQYIGDSTDRDFPRPAIKFDDRVWYEWQLTNSNEMSWVERCQWKPSDHLYVRETLYQNGELGLKYVADNEWIDEKIIPDDHKPYRNYAFCNIPSIHMPKYLARIWLKVESVRVERLQDISEEDAIAEGVEKLPGSGSSTRFDYRHYDYARSFNVDAKVSFRTLWEKINGADSWQANPFVWVVTFAVLSTTGKPDLQTT